MKRFLLLFFLLIFIFACDKGNDGPGDNGGDTPGGSGDTVRTLKIFPDSIVLSSPAAIDTCITITGEGDWKIQVNEKWFFFHDIRKEGSGSKKLVLYIKENLSIHGRVDTIKINNKNILVKQGGANVVNLEDKVAYLDTLFDNNLALYYGDRNGIISYSDFRLDMNPKNLFFEPYKDGSSEDYVLRLYLDFTPDPNNLIYHLNLYYKGDNTNVSYNSVKNNITTPDNVLFHDGHEYYTKKRDTNYRIEKVDKNSFIIYFDEHKVTFIEDSYYLYEGQFKFIFY